MSKERETVVVKFLFADNTEYTLTLGVFKDKLARLRAGIETLVKLADQFPVIAEGVAFQLLDKLKGL